MKEAIGRSGVVIVPADKGRAAVVLDRLDYDGKINHLLTDEQSYQKLTRDLAPALERRMNCYFP